MNIPDQPIIPPMPENKKDFSEPMAKYYKAFSVGGNPEKADTLPYELADTLRKIQSAGWIVEDVARVNIQRSWYGVERKYIPFLQYIIVAYADRDKVRFDRQFEHEEDDANGQRNISEETEICCNAESSMD